MICNYYKPLPVCATIVDHYWYFKFEMASSGLQHYHTPLILYLAFNFYSGQDFIAKNNCVIQLDKPFYFFGQQTNSRVMGTSERKVHALGVKFRPLGMTKLTGINMEQMANNIIGAEDIWGREVDCLGDELQSASTGFEAIKALEFFLLRKFTQQKINHRMNAVDHALSLIENSNGTINIREIQRKTNTLRKTLERGFMNYLGIMPKLYSRINRFNAAKEWLDTNILDQNLPVLAYDMAYCDGSHLSAEFKRFSNMTPLEYLQKRRETIPVI